VYLQCSMQKVTWIKQNCEFPEVMSASMYAEAPRCCSYYKRWWYHVWWSIWSSL